MSQLRQKAETNDTFHELYEYDVSNGRKDAEVYGPWDFNKRRLGRYCTDKGRAKSFLGKLDTTAFLYCSYLCVCVLL